MSNALIVFVKNPELGKVKTRLAKTIGAEMALFIYQKLLTHTQAVCKQVAADCFVYYNDFVDEKDDWVGCNKRLQSGHDLGNKMQEAFNEVFLKGFSKAVIIGSDCLDITTEVIETAFTQLDIQDIVIGPANDGGYYLLGMKTMHPFLFEDKSWSTDIVLQQTLADLEENNLSYSLLPTLSDIDEEKDLAGTQLL